MGLILFAVGAAIVAAAEDTAVARQVSFMASSALCSGALGTSVFSLLWGRGYRGVSFWERIRRPQVTQFDRLAVYVGFALSLTISVAFVYVTITSSAAEALLSVAAIIYGDALISVRVAITSGDAGYFAPGYVKQFRDILAPVVLVALAWGGFRGRRVLGPALFIASVGAILISGQRLPFVVLVLTVLGGGYLQRRSQLRRRSALKSMRGVITSALVLSVLSAMTFLLGRVEEGTPVWLVPITTVVGLAERAVTRVPSENVETFDIWWPMGPTEGVSWVADLTAIMPGPAGRTLSNLLHLQTGGSDLGNVVLSLSNDLWVAWGWFGVLALPFIYGLAVGALDLALIRIGSVTCLATRLYMFLALPIMYSPYGFILYGGAFAFAVVVGSTAFRVVYSACRCPEPFGVSSGATVA